MEFSRDELNAILILGVISGIIVTFKEFVILENFHILLSINPGLIYLLLGIIGMIVSVYIHEAGHKFFAGAIGYKTNTESYYPGQIIGLVLAIFSFGLIQFYTPNTMDLEARPEQRMHKLRKFENFRQQAFIAASGILTTAVWATLLHGLWISTGSSIVRDIMLGNIWIMVYSLIPFELLNIYMLRLQQNIEQLPQSDGLYIFHYSPTAYVVAAAFALFAGVILAFTASVPVWIALVLAMIAGVVVWFRFFLASN